MFVGFVSEDIQTIIMNAASIVVLDIGGTKINAGRFYHGKVVENREVSFPANGNAAQVLQFIIECIDSVIHTNTQAIAIGVPCIVDIEQGIVFNAVNIPAWQQYPLKAELEKHYGLTVYVNNDVNCFVAGEGVFGAGKSYQNILGVCLGTGFGSALIINQQLYAGANCCAGEAGGISYLSGTVDDYCSGKFFHEHYQMTGEQLAQRAEQGDSLALAAFQQFGTHLGKVLSMLLLVFDPQVIVLGGSVSKSYGFFIDSLWQELGHFPYPVVTDKLMICKSELTNAALLGAANLYLQSQI